MIETKTLKFDLIHCPIIGTIENRANYVEKDLPYKVILESIIWYYYLR